MGNSVFYYNKKAPPHVMHTMTKRINLSVVCETEIANLTLTAAPAVIPPASTSPGTHQT